MDRAGRAGCFLGVGFWGLGLLATPLAAQHLPPAPQQLVTSTPSRTSSAQAAAPDPLVAGHDLQVGTFYYNRGDYVGALHRFQDATANDPASAEASCRAGDAENKLKNTAPARQDWQRCLRTATGHPASQDSARWAKHARQALAKLPQPQSTIK